MTAVARHWQVCPQQVWGWRREAREGRLVLPETASVVAVAPNFVPIVTEAMPATTDACTTETAPRQSAKMAPLPGIEVRLAGAVVRIASDTDAALLTAVLRAVRASAT